MQLREATGPAMVIRREDYTPPPFWIDRIELRLAPLPRHRLLGVCHFPSFHAAMDSARHIVDLGPAAVELVDRTMLELSRDIALFREVVAGFVRGTPAALLLVEFAGDDSDE